MNSDLEYIMMCKQIAVLRSALRTMVDTRWELPTEYRSMAVKALVESRDVEDFYRGKEERDKWVAEVVYESKIADGTLERNNEQSYSGEYRQQSGPTVRDKSRMVVGWW